ncbi:MAG: winged helix-turn-helix domain-containing protein [Terriglobales bacterium]|jgi:DNA-binding winged helix-turn-helix (wHTH) protein
MSIYRFGPFEVRTVVRELYRSGTKIRLRGQPFQLLQILLNRHGEIVSREQMRAELWPSDTFVDFEHGINASLRKLRIALGESAAKPLYIETLPGEGYRFIAPYEIAEEPSNKANESDAEQDLVANVMDRVEETAPLEPNTAPDRRKWVLFALSAGIVVFVGLFLYAAKWNRRVVHGATPILSDAQTAINSAAQYPNALALEHGSASDKENSSPRSSTLYQGSRQIQGKIWVVSVAEASHVIFPPPNRTPDALFTTASISFNGGIPDRCYTLMTFLNGCANRISELKFSGIPNPNLDGAAAGPDTAMSGPTWGILIEFTGTARLANGQKIQILHDDGVALKIDRQPISGFNPFVTAPTEESAVFTGSSGAHSFDLLYANASGGGAWIFFYPVLYEH